MAAALSAAGPATAARFQARGIKFKFGADIIGFAGPQFTYGSLEFEQVNATGSEEVAFVWVNSTSLPTPQPYFGKRNPYPPC